MTGRGVFISYRREDSAGDAGRLYDWLARHFGAERVFRDVNTLLPGTNFGARIEEAISSCGALLAVIGPGWEGASDLQGPRPVDPTDFVQVEIETALARGISVIPILVRGARMPSLDHLPGPLRPLARRHALELDDARWDSDLGRLVATLERLLGDPVTGEPIEERKVVTVLFCDLVGFTASSEGVDPEDVRARIRPYHAKLREEIEAFGGTLEKFIGDAAMAMFGAPVPHEDDPERAVRAALQVLGAISELNEQDPTLDLSVRIGIATGEAVVILGAKPEAGEGMVAGDVVNTASRLQGVAPVGEIVVSDATYRFTKRLFDYEELKPVIVKGKSQPVAIWRVLAARSRFGVDVTRSHAVPLVGRELELRLVQDTFGRGVRESSVQLVTIVGEPGIGKTRLVAELLAHVDALPELVAWRQGRCLPYGEGITFWALGEIVKAQAGIFESDSPAAVEAKLEEAVESVVAESREWPWFRARLSPLVGLSPTSPAEREESFTAWRRFLEAIAVNDPLVVVLEDLHWADPAMLEFIEHLIEYASAVPLFVLATARPELYERHHTWGAGMRNASVIELGPLGVDETARLVSALLERAVLPPDTQSLLLERAGGNPLYAEEFVRVLTDQGLVDQSGRLIGDHPDIAVPATVQALIAARLGTLTSERKSLLQDAAVIGKVFWSGALAYMGDRDEEAVREGLHELARKELVRPARVSSVSGQAEYSFWHVLVQDVAYSEIPRAPRAEKHRRAAAWIEQLAGDRVSDHAEILAHHSLRALELFRAAGRVEPIDDLGTAARRYLILAGDRSLSLDSAVAETSFRRALELTPPEDPMRVDIMGRLAESLLARAHFAEAEAAFREAIEGFKARGDIHAAAVAMARWGIVLWRLGDHRHRDVAAEAVRLLEALPPGPELVAALAEQAGSFLVAGDNRAAVRAGDLAISLAAELHLPEPAKALGFRGAARPHLGDPGGLDDLRRGFELAQSQGLGREGGVIQANLANHESVINGPRPALRTYREVAIFGSRRGMQDVELAVGCMSSSLLVHLGSWEEALTVAPELARRAEEAGDMFSLITVRETTLAVFVARGDVDQGTAIAGTTLRSAREIGDMDMLAGCLPHAAALAVARGDPAEAIKLVEELESIPNIRENHTFSWWLPVSVRTGLAAGDPQLAQKLVSDLEPVLPLQENALKAARALLSEFDGEYPEASDTFADAAERWKRWEMPFEHAQALLGRGRCLLALGQPRDASDALRSAREIFASLGARPALDETDTLLSRSTALTS